MVSSGSTGILRSLRIRTLKNKGFEGPQTLVIEGSTSSKEGPRILRDVSICPRQVVFWMKKEATSEAIAGVAGETYRFMHSVKLVFFNSKRSGGGTNWLK